MINYLVIILICWMVVFFCEVCTVSITFLPLFIQFFCVDAMSVSLILPIFQEIRYSWISYLHEVLWEESIGSDILDYITQSFTLARVRLVLGICLFCVILFHFLWFCLHFILFWFLYSVLQTLKLAFSLKKAIYFQGVYFLCIISGIFGLVLPTTPWTFLSPFLLDSNYVL